MHRSLSRFEFPVERRAFTAVDKGALSVFGADAGPRRGSRNVLAAYETSPRVQMTFDLISESIASLPLRAYRARTPAARRRIAADLARADAETTRTGTDVGRQMLARMLATEELVEVDSPLLRLLSAPMDMAFPDAMSSWEWRAHANLHMELTGNFWSLIVSGSRNDVERAWSPSEGVRELLPIPDPWVQARPGGFFEIHGPSGARWPLVHGSRLVCLRRHRPADPFGRGIGKAQTLADEIDVDEAAAQYLAALLSNHGSPGIAIQVEKSTPEQRLQIMLDLSRKHRGVANAGRPLVTSGKIDVKTFGDKPSDLELLQERQYSSDVIRESVGVPPEQVGQIKNSNRATVRESYAIFARNCLFPRCRRFDDHYTHRLGRYFAFGELDLIRHDSPMPADVEAEEVARGQALWGPTWNEWRAKQGLEKRDGPEGDLIMIPQGSQLVPLNRVIELSGHVLEQAKEAAKPKPVPQPGTGGSPGKDVKK